MPDEKATQRNYTVTMSNALSAEIRQVAASMELPLSTVRAIVSAPALFGLHQSEGAVRKMVAGHFAEIAEAE